MTWKKCQASRAAVRVIIETVFDELPRACSKELFDKKCNVMCQHVFDSYCGQDGDRTHKCNSPDRN